ncbi:MAG TPA: ABC transporter permease, partial [Desulfatiglandales bacterium]|nr:ABC transporter permease [Desulfatiglandales bacterium]
DPDILDIVLVSIKVSLIATSLATLIGVPLGFIIGINEFKGKKIVTILLNTLMAVPTVVVGLTVYAFISRQGPFGSLGLLFSPSAIIIGDIILGTPIITAFTFSAVQGLDKRISMTAATLGANKLQIARVIISEARFGVFAAIIAGFGRVIAEVGSAIMLGGNIKGYSRTITTAIALETSKGEFGFGIALGIILLTVAFSINILFYYFQRKQG